MRDSKQAFILSLPKLADGTQEVANFFKKSIQNYALRFNFDASYSLPREDLELIQNEKRTGFGTSIYCITSN